MTEEDMADSEPLINRCSNKTCSKEIRFIEPLTLPRGTKKYKAIALVTLLLTVSSFYLLLSPSFGSTNETQVWTPSELRSTDSKEFQNADIVPSGSLIWSSGCRIPDIDPFDYGAMKHFHPRRYHSCSRDPTLTFIEEDFQGNVMLRINFTAVEMLHKSNENVSCCYSNITRSPNPKNADTKVKYSSCKIVDNQIKLLPTEEFITVRCQIQNKHMKYKKRMKIEAHTNIQPNARIRKRLELFDSNTSSKPWNVLMIGVDTLSRINLMRAMPKTHSYLKTHRWLNFQAYNKIGENTFPNLMGFLTGRNNTRSRVVCDGDGKYSPDYCDFMWKQYENVGYVTAYAEDFTGIDTFGKPAHKGFIVPPTDHYIRPFLSANEKHISESSGHTYHCVGQQSSGEAIFSYALQFVRKYKNDPFFGFFWTNTFSHNDVSEPLTMDDKMERFLMDIEETGILNDTFVWFLGDHGMRFGEMRYLLTGYYEDRLPSLVLSVPPKFKEVYGDLYSTLISNTKRLTTPYDLYMTLQDILRLSGRRDVLIPGEACPNCQSLMTPIDFDRTCSDCSVSSQWCACNPLQSISVNNKIAKRAITYLIDEIVEKVFTEVNTNSKCRLCSKLKFNKIFYVYSVDDLQKNENSNEYVIVFSVNPGNIIFEMMVWHDLKHDNISIPGTVNRLTTYTGQGDCVKPYYLKKYCYCNKKCYKKKHS